jgi:hypothetical protein
MQKIVFVLLIIIIITSCCCEASSIEATVYCTKQQQDGKSIACTYSPATYDTVKGTAFAKYIPSLNTTGWDILRLGTNSLYSDDIQSYAAGFLEGVLTCSQIELHYVNMNSYTWYNETNKAMPAHVSQFFENQRQWMQEETQKYSSDDHYWNLVGTINQQQLGLIDGFHSVSSLHISYTDFQTMGSFGDIWDIINTHPQYRPNYSKLSKEQILKIIAENSHCSALIKLKDDLSDIFFGHNTWWTYSSMIRIYKEYTFEFKNPVVKSKTVNFSSYPANLASNDDWLITDQNLVVIETSNQIFEAAVYDRVTPRSLLCWQRVMLANRMASTGKEWTDVFAKYNSGTYNNQYMILDLKQVDIVRKQLKPSTLWILEQIPGRVEAADVTNILSFGYWPSYNVPFFTSIRTESGYDKILERDPSLADELDYQNCARANIFRRDQSTVVDLESMKRIIRYNNFKHDPLSKNKPNLALACRHDLAQGSSIACGGAIDAKISSYQELIGKQKIHIIAGPTSDQQPVFDWRTTQCADHESSRYSHRGIPDLMKFDWMSLTFKTINRSNKRDYL